MRYAVADCSSREARPTATADAQSIDPSADPAAAATPDLAPRRLKRNTKNVSGPGVIASNRLSPTNAMIMDAVIRPANQI
jgi:hypothetical protein